MTTFTPEQKLTIIKHLATGKSAEVVAAIMRVPETTIIDVAKHHGYPDTDKLQWAADILSKQPTSTIAERPLPSEAAGARPAPTASRTTIAPAVPAHSPASPDDTRALINQAKSHPSKRIQAAADRAFDAINNLRKVMVEDEQKNHEKRKAAAAKAKARAEVERLEAELRAAKAKLKGTTPAKPKPAAAPAEKPASGRQYPCRNAGCDDVRDSPQGRSMHERLHCAHRPEAAAS